MQLIYSQLVQIYVQISLSLPQNPEDFHSCLLLNTECRLTGGIPIPRPRPLIGGGGA